MAEGTRVPVLPPAPVATLPAAPYAPPAVLVASVVTDSKAEDPCVCPLGASLPAAAMSASIQNGDARRDPAVAELVSCICASVKALPQAANAEDLEASIVFAIAQSKAHDAVVRQALAMMVGFDNGWSNMPAALRRVQDGLGKLNRGTASLGSGFLGSGSSFSARTLAVGGGSANYGI
ncbi:hypothetical protein [Sphingomonas gellani]|nr:hypothetical protein [Sphingomonas gellani]